PAGALVQLAHVAVEPYDRPELAQRARPAFTARQTPAGRDDFARLQLEALERVGLELTESRLTRVAEDLGDRAALAGDDHVVGLDEATAETAREQPPAHRFSGTHEPHENDVIPPHPRIVSDHPLPGDEVGWRQCAMDGACRRGRTRALGSVTRSLESPLFELRTRRGGPTPPIARVRPRRHPSIAHSRNPSPPAVENCPLRIAAGFGGLSGGQFFSRGCGGRRSRASSIGRTG